jgi:NadR type nicotinamide-nucleotide adenylyltransferase
MRELFPDLRVIHIDRDLPQEPRDHPRFWDIWREVVTTAAGESIQYILASESYGHRLAAEVGAVFVPVDVDRRLVPVSGTAIRERPLENWRFIPECVRPYFVKRVCVFGPESTGKSTLARDLAAQFDTVHVPEFARSWLDPKQGVCDREDIPMIARGQIAAEDSLARRANRILICDTDVLTTTVWSDVLFGECPEWIRSLAARRSYDHYLLLDVDVPWVNDTQRFLSYQRAEFFERCRSVLVSHGRKFTVVRGSWPQRFATACDVVETLLKPMPAG